MIETRSSGPDDVDDLLRIWRAAVDASHSFLSPEDRAAIDPLVASYVSEALLTVAVIDGVPVGFMGTTGQNIDALFVDPQYKGRGIGQLLTDQVPMPATVDVNEQNEAAVSFYRHLGFEVIGRSELDDQGRPYPLLHLRRD